jgi:hypothetical protein
MYCVTVSRSDKGKTSYLQNTLSLPASKTGWMINKAFGQKNFRKNTGTFQNLVSMPNFLTWVSLLRKLCQKKIKIYANDDTYQNWWNLHQNLLGMIDPIFFWMRGNLWVAFIFLVAELILNWLLLNKYLRVFVQVINSIHLDKKYLPLRPFLDKTFFKLSVLEQFILCRKILNLWMFEYLPFLAPWVMGLRQVHFMSSKTV